MFLLFLDITDDVSAGLSQVLKASTTGSAGGNTGQPVEAGGVGAGSLRE